MDLAERIAELEAENAALRATVGVLEAELGQLRRRVDRHSGNSGKPPSSDSLGQRDEQNEQRVSRAERRRRARAKAKKLQAGRPKRSPGKQPGDPGANLAKVTDPDRVVDHVPGACGGCGADLGDAEVLGSEDRQMFDLATRRLEVTEHRGQRRRCGCGAVTKAAFPAVASAPAAYGPRVRAVALYLMCSQHVPVARTAELLSSVCGAPVSTGWLAGLAGEAAGGLGGFLHILRAQLKAELVLHADETGARVSGAQHWFHVACTDLLTLLDCHPKRGVDAFNDMGVLPHFAGVLVTDGWKPYWTLEAAEHALCGAHLLRDLAAIAGVDAHQQWADTMADLLVEAKTATETALADGRPGLDARVLRRFRTRYTKIVNQGRACVPDGHRTGTYDRDAHNLLRRLDTQRGDICRFWEHGAVGFDNNQAERDLRMVKLQQKISGCFRTPTGARNFAAIRSYVHTAAKHGLNQLDVLTQLFQGHPWTPPPTGPP